MDSRIWIILTDDWELPGDGRGDVDTHQRRPARRLMDLYDRLRVPATFCVDGLQAEAFEREAPGRPDLSRELSLWERTVREMGSRGFDVQAHAHAQWLDAVWQESNWRVGRDWNLACYSKPRQEAAILGVRDRLRSLHPGILPRAFRGGSWGVYSPGHGSLIPVLIRAGFRIDVSMAAGLHMDGDAVQLDYRDLESPWLPWWPDLEDPRRIGREVVPLVMVPTQTFAAGDVSRWQWLGSRISARLQRGLDWRSGNEDVSPASVGMADGPGRDPFGFDSGRACPERMVLDFSACIDLPAWCLAMDTLIVRAMNTTGRIIPLVLENHSKRFSVAQENLLSGLIGHLRGRWGGNIRFATLGELAGVSDQLNPLFKGRSRTVRQACLKQGILQRIADVLPRLRGANPDFSRPAEDIHGDQAEEDLRRLMIGIRRKLAVNPGDRICRGQAMEILPRTATCAAADLRFLDAWNTFWEIDPQLVDGPRYLGLLLTWREMCS